MGDLTLRINANFNKAQEAFEELADSSEETRKQMERFAKQLEGGEVDEFNRKQKMLQNSLMGTRGETAALEASVRNYTREIERNIRNGMNPNGDAIRALRAEQEQLQKRIDASREAQERKTKAMQAAKTAFKASAIAVAGAVTGIIALTKRTASAGNAFLNYGRIVGVTAETMQELTHAAEMSGVAGSTLKYGMNRLNAGMIELRNGTGKLHAALGNTSQELLNNMKNARNSEEAFNIMVSAIESTECQLKRTELSMVAFGRRAGPEMMLLTNQGADGIHKLREEARELGIISNENAEAGEKFNDAIARLKKAVNGIVQELAVRLIPALTHVVERVTNFVTSFNDWERVLKIAGTALAAVTISLGAFMIAVKGYAMVQKMAAAVKVMKVAFLALNKAMKANPIVAIIAVTVAAVGALIGVVLHLKRNWDYFSTYAEQAMAAVGFAVGVTASRIRETFTVVINTVRILFLRLAETVITAVFGRIASALEGFGSFISIVFPNAGAAIQNLGQTVGGLADGFSKMAEAAKDSSRDTIDAAREEQAAMRDAHRERLDGINNDARARRDALRNIEKYNEEFVKKALEMTEKHVGNAWAVANAYYEAGEVIKKSLRERLNAVALTENQIKNERINTIESFLIQRAKLESDDTEARIAFLKEKHKYLLESEALVGDERIAMEKAVQNAIRALQRETVEAAKEASENMLKAYSVFFGGFSKMLGAAGKENRAFFIASRMMAIVQATINTSLAITKTLAQFGGSPAGMIKAVGVGMKGMGKVAKIKSSMISAETGGRFVVPESRGVDNTLMRVNPGEQIDVLSRGMANAGGGVFNFSLVVDGQVLAEVLNKRAEAGEMYNLVMASNL